MVVAERKRLARENFGPQAVVVSKKTYARLRIKDGEIVTHANFDPVKHLKALSDKELWFLDLWRKCGYEDDAALRKSGVSVEEAKRLCKRLAPFKEQDAYMRNLANIPTPEFLLAKDMESIHSAEERKLTDSDHKSMDRIGKIIGAFKTPDASASVNVFNIQLAPEQEKKAKEFFDAIAAEEKVA